MPAPVARERCRWYILGFLVRDSALTRVRVVNQQDFINCTVMLSAPLCEGRGTRPSGHGAQGTGRRPAVHSAPSDWMAELAEADCDWESTRATSRAACASATQADSTAAGRSKEAASAHTLCRAPIPPPISDTVPI